ncbi:hypothetical protein CDZ97_23785 [Mameliella alba]|uniref:Uncharacterized protein DUF4268 n=1 Tax=Celeribacter persicus TaxID=1651082 RepID=A0A2T5HME6_9RHOB|nr:MULTISPECIES: DUF4268 domain-containing protein [Roseobacteraceae]OWV55188.1 hypothetical protein CDZ97_23785 [Mameliella alba]PTQ72755.1 uncharacterized protein DUF4268 [Celeribacter persicus]
MFQIDRSANRLRKLERTSFSEVGFREREHLQEWLASMPEALGETLGDDLLIIQKEFDGFDGTRERLDLLALDRNGQLVVIENKLDDSGRDVVWQALKYAAYCSSLKKAEIVDIFQKYLGASGDAVTMICEFLEEDSFDEIVLNEGNDQRVVFIAANFRREVTATVLWLREHQIDARCIKAIPYRFGEELFLDLQQVIPTPEAADYMIRMAQKETEEKSAIGVQRRSHQLRLAFWEKALEAMRERGLSLFANISPSKDHWLSAGTGISGCVYNLIFSKDEARVEISLQRANKTENKWLFDQLYSERDGLERDFGAALDWKRMEDRKSSRIQFSRIFDGFSEEAWPEMIDWLGEHMQRLEATFHPRLVELNQRLKSGEAMI